MTGAHDRAVDNLGLCNSLRLAGRDIRLASMVREGDMRPLPRGVRGGKQASLLAIDTAGNFIVRDAAGAVLLVDRLSGEETFLAASIRAFVEAIGKDTN